MNAYASSSRPKPTRRLVIVIVAIAVLFALLVGFHIFQGAMIGKYMRAMGNQAQTVSTTVVKYQDWQATVDAFGNVRAVHGTDLAFDVAGLVADVAVKSGTDVRKGELLASLVQEQDRAGLASAQATAQLARLTAKRAKQQLAVQAISQAEYDTDMANLKGAQANVAAQQALVDKKTLRAPFAGRVGIITVSPGQYLAAGTKVVTLQQLDPVYVDFTLPQSSLQRLAAGSPVTVSSDAFAGAHFAGKLTAIDPKVDLATRNIAVEATVPNPKKQLMPGMFTRVMVASGGSARYLTLPQTAVVYAPYGDTVFVVRAGEPPVLDADGKPVASAPAAASGAQAGSGPAHYVAQVVVKLGPTRGDQVAVVSGIKEGDVVVTSGGLKLKNGSRVDINNTVQPAFSPDPTPAEH